MITRTSVPKATPTRRRTCARNNLIKINAILPDITANDRHIVPPRAIVEMAERLGMFDDGVPDYTRFMVWNTPYRDWYKALSLAQHNDVPPVCGSHLQPHRHR